MDHDDGYLSHQITNSKLVCTECQRKTYTQCQYWNRIWGYFRIGIWLPFRQQVFPLIIGAEASIPSGNTLLDDFKVKAGAHLRWAKIHDVQFSTRIQGIFRKFENKNVAISNFGVDMAGVIGYYRPTWFAGGEVGFDKAIVTHFRHSEHYKEIYPEVKNGWYEPATGGNFIMEYKEGTLSPDRKSM